MQYVFISLPSVLDLVNGFRNNKLTVHHVTLRSHAKAFITSPRLLTIEECSIAIAVNK